MLGLDCTVCKNENFSSVAFSYRLYSIGRTQNIPENVCSFGIGTQNQWVPTKNVPV